MNTPDDRLMQLIRAAREEATMGSKEDPSTDTLLAYLRGELGVEERLGIQRRLAASAELRAELLELAELEDEGAPDRFDAVEVPPVPSLSSFAGSRRGRSWRAGAGLALAAVLLLALLPRLRSSDPVEVGADQWREMSRLRVEQFEPSTMRGEGEALPPTMPTPRLALVAALLRTVEWSAEGGWIGKADLADPELTRNGTAFELTRPVLSPAEGLAFFDLQSRTLWSYELEEGADPPTRFAFPGPTTPDWLLLRWWNDGDGFRATAVAGRI